MPPPRSGTPGRFEHGGGNRHRGFTSKELGSPDPAICLAIARCCIDVPSPLRAPSSVPLTPRRLPDRSGSGRPVDVRATESLRDRLPRQSQPAPHRRRRRRSWRPASAASGSARASPIPSMPPTSAPSGTCRHRDEDRDRPSHAFRVRPRSLRRPRPHSQGRESTRRLQRSLPIAAATRYVSASPAPETNVFDPDDVESAGLATVCRLELRKACAGRPLAHRDGEERTAPRRIERPITHLEVRVGRAESSGHLVLASEQSAPVTEACMLNTSATAPLPAGQSHGDLACIATNDAPLPPMRIGNHQAKQPAAL